MTTELIETEKVGYLFNLWEETLIYSCLDKTMGKIFVTDDKSPESACAYIGCFAFFAGKPDAELIGMDFGPFVIMVPQDDNWCALIEKKLPGARKTVRYATRKDTKFDEKKLQDYTRQLPHGYEIKKIDSKVYNLCLKNSETSDLVSNFGTMENYLRHGRGFAVVKNGEVVSGASSYSYYDGGIEIQVDTVKSERQRNLATAVCSKLILDCINSEVYPSWDAQNINSLHLAQKLGYEFSHEYTVYEVRSE